MQHTYAIRSRRLPVRPRRLLTLAAVATLAAACSEPAEPLAITTGGQADAMAAQLAADLPPILPEVLSGPRRFTDNIAVQVRVKPDGRPTNVVNMQDASNMAVMRFTVQPGVRFPWHSHPGLVLVNVVQGEMVFVYADDCVRRPYDSGSAFVDPGFGTVHYAYNPTDGETVLVATFLGVPAGAPLTNPVPQAEGDALDLKCNVPAPGAPTH